VSALPHGVLLTYYGDDFTGSTDVAEVLTFSGLPTVLFLDAAAIDLAPFPECRAVGLAGVSRSQSPGWMTHHLPALYRQLQNLGGALCHYKVCSTFDSSPQTGSIGRAIELGREVFGAHWTPLVVGAPALDRYTVFGNLFATIKGTAYRLDRHPTMSRHPVTPMQESDLRRVLASQGRCEVTLFDLLALQSPDYRVRFAALLEGHPEVVLFDTLDRQSLERAGELIWESRGNDPFFAAGSSGLEYALVAYWRRAGLLPEAPAPPPAEDAGRIVVASGSCSPQTEQQVRWALTHGYHGLRLDASALANGDSTTAEAAVASALRALSEGRSVVLYSALGPEDPALARGDTALPQRLAEQTGRILREVLLRSGVRRTIVAGGDTSSHAGRQLGLKALVPFKPATPGAPLCRAWADGPLDGLEIVFKGGQRGDADFFESVRRGG
jgi:3-oxoisoapionate kinase